MIWRYVIAIALLLGAPEAALAHAALVKATPGSRAVLSHMPEKIELCFNEMVELKFSAVGLKDEKDEPVQLGEVAIGGTPKCIVSTVSPAGAGTYKIEYRVLSLDGHIIESSYRFTVKPEPAAPK